MMTEHSKPKKYESVNGQWPAETREGRDLKPTAQEAIHATRKLYRKFMGKPWRGTFRATSGRRYSYPRGGVYFVNPDWNGGGWHEVVHFVSHVVAGRLYGEAHGPRHAFIEKQMIDHVVRNGWHLGALRKPDKPVPDKRKIQIERDAAALKRWQSKLKRAENAIKKLKRKIAARERRLAA